MFEEKVSAFKNYYSEPKTITLCQWLKSCKEGSRFAKQVLEYRQTGDERLKKSLPMVTVGAECSGGRKLENVIHRTGWIALDIDGKDNPGIGSAECLRNEVAKITNVAFVSLSTGGKGVWALVKVSDPMRIPDHFAMLLEDFKTLGIALDRSKGRNPNDARFYSFDPDAIVKVDFTAYNKLPDDTNQNSGLYTAKISLKSNVKSSKYGDAALIKELEKLSEAQKGERNNTLFRCAANLGELVAGGHISSLEVHDSLERVAFSIGLGAKETENTIQSGFKKGLSNPRVL